MFKPLSITLPENMIRRIDEMLFKKDFASRSDLFRHLARMWLSSIDVASPNGTDEQMVAEDDFSYGISAKDLDIIKAKAKLLN